LKPGGGERVRKRGKAGTQPKYNKGDSARIEELLKRIAGAFGAS